VRVRIPESLLVEVWKRQFINKEALLTDKGLEVVYPGRENRDAGPDFCDALIWVEGRGLLKGDVELHISPKEWQHHGHHKDPNYRGVILHVVLWDEPSSYDGMPVLALYPYLKKPLEELEQWLPSQEQPCSQALGEEAIAGLLDKAGGERFHLKVEQFKGELAVRGAEEVLYEGIMGALGYAKNKEPFTELARRLPLNTLKGVGEPLLLQTLLLGMAGLLPSQRYIKDGREGEKLEEVWESLGIKERMEGIKWKFFRVRPENFPTRRIAALSYLLVKYGRGLLEAMEQLINQAQSYRELETAFIVTTNGYWANHCDFGVETRWNPSLIGWGRAREIVVNILLPFFLAWTEDLNLKEKILKLYQNYPRLGENWITRYMEGKVLGGHNPKLVNSALRQQGLIHLYKNFCGEGECHSCPLAFTF